MALTGRPRLRAEFAFGSLAAALAVAVAATASLANHRLFLTDDYATYYMPDFREIARLFGQGHFPLVSERLWNGGAFLQEHQLAVFNPVSMLLYAAIGQTTDLALAAELYALAHIGIFAAGVYFLCRVLQCAPRHAFVAAVLAPLSDWIFYWGATNWISILVSLAWLTWAWALLILTARRTTYFSAAALAVALTLLSGWPMADLALLLSLGIAADRLVLSAKDRRLAPAAWVALAVLCGALLAAPALVPLGVYDAYIKRPIETGVWPAELPALLGVGMPYFVTHWRTGGDNIQNVFQPMIYVAWFAPLALANADWARLRRTPRGSLLIWLAAAFAIASLLPSLWQFRGMFRFLPYYQLAVLALATLALSQSEAQGRPWRFDRIRWVVLAEAGLAICQAPQLGRVYLAVGIALAICGWAGARLLQRRGLGWPAFALAVSFAVFWLTLLATVRAGYPLFPATRSLQTVSGTPASLSAPGPTRLALYNGIDLRTLGSAGWSAYAPGNIGLERPGTVVVGYSNIPSPAFISRLCVGHLGTYCPDIIRRVTTPAAPTGVSLIDLMSVDEVYIEASKDALLFGSWAGAAWTKARGPAGEWRFDRIKPSGLVSWTSPGVAAAVTSQEPARIGADVRNDGPSPGTLVLARAWYPGWRARLDGQPIAVRALDGLLVAVDLPPRSHGRLEVTFWPSGLTAGLSLAALAILMLVLAASVPQLVDRSVAWLDAALAKRFRRKADIEPNGEVSSQ